MITLRPSNERGNANHGWLDSWHSFSFANYFDLKYINWGALRVINDVCLGIFVLELCERHLDRCRLQGGAQQ